MSLTAACRGAAMAALAAAAMLAAAGCSGAVEPAPTTEVRTKVTAAPSVVAAEPDGDAETPAPPKSDPAAYTRFVVQQAVDRYDAEGLDAVLSHINSAANFDSQWYVFVIDADGTVIGHPEKRLLGESLHGWVGTDVNGYEFGPEMLAAEESGRWVPYVYVNPPGGTLAGGEFELKNAWVMRHDGLLFGSGWYIDAEQFLPALIAEAAEHFRVGGLEATLAFYNDPQGISAGLIPTVDYYNRTDTLQGYFAGFIAAPDGEILAHFDSGLIGTDIEDLLGPAIREAAAEGAWITHDDNPAGAPGPETMRVWAVDVDGTVIGGGWYRD